MVKKYIISFLLGFLFCLTLFSFSSDYFFSITGFGISDFDTPSNKVYSENVTLFEDYVVIRIKNATLSNYESTGSMIPVLDKNSKGLRIVPESSDEINLGDIVSFRQGELLIVHRVVEKGFDEEGVYFVTKGDSNSFRDEKIRFSDIEYVTVGVLW